MEKQILDIARFLFDDDDFKLLESYLIQNKYSDIAGFIEEQKEITNILLSFDNTNIELIKTKDKLKEIEYIFTDLYLGIEIING